MTFSIRCVSVYMLEFCPSHSHFPLCSPTLVTYIPDFIKSTTFTDYFKDDGIYIEKKLHIAVCYSGGEL